jgi:hypothetical protein
VKRYYPLLITLLAGVQTIARAQQAGSPDRTITVADNLVTEGIPALPYTIAEDIEPYIEARSASIAAWHPVQKKI